MTGAPKANAEHSAAGKASAAGSLDITAVIEFQLGNRGAPGFKHRRQRTSVDVLRGFAQTRPKATLWSCRGVGPLGLARCRTEPAILDSSAFNASTVPAGRASEEEGVGGPSLALQTCPLAEFSG